MKRALTAGEVYGALLFAAGVVLGTFRALVVEPATGALLAVALELPVMLALAWLIARWAIARWQIPARAGPRLGMGAVALSVVVLAEVVFARLVFGVGLADALASFATPPALLGLAGQILAAGVPLLQGLRGD